MWTFTDYNISKNKRTDRMRQITWRMHLFVVPRSFYTLDKNRTKNSDKYNLINIHQLFELLPNTDFIQQTGGTSRVRFVHGLSARRQIVIL